MNTVNISSIMPDRYEIREAFKTLRTNVLFCGADIKTIVITSSAQNEGKSVIALELAKSLSEAGKKILMIDADLRKSVIATRNTTETGMIGLSHYLSGQAEADEIIYETQYENFNLVFSGPFPPNPVELVGSQKFIDLLNYYRSKYDYIIIDTPPVGSVIDGAVIAAHCDSVILAIAANKINFRLAQAVKSQLERGNCRIIGTVLNMVDTESSGYNKYYSRYYRKYYSHYYRYGKQYGYYSQESSKSSTAYSSPDIKAVKPDSKTTVKK